jgi:nitronate monooxygenase
VFELGGLRLPIVQAPMAGGPSTPGLVTAVGQAGGLGFLAAGYQTAEALAGQIEAVRAGTTAAFGVNVFVPQPRPDASVVAAYRDELAAEAERYGVALPEPDPGDDDHWDSKIKMLIEQPVPVVSFTFGVPARDVVSELHRAGTYVLGTVTSQAEARLAAAAGVDGLCVQGPGAGAHRGTFDVAAEPGRAPLGTLLTEIGHGTELPLIAAGGLATGSSIAAALRAGARAAQVGTGYLRTAESGAKPAYQAALADPRFGPAIVTRAFSGRPARGLRNRFTDAHHATAPAAYPLVNQLTQPLRAAAAARGDADGLSLWAGSGYRYATEEPAGQVTVRLWETARAELGG